jgi:hypothetical protein
MTCLIVLNLTTRVRRFAGLNLGIFFTVNIVTSEGSYIGQAVGNVCRIYSQNMKQFLEGGKNM